jgi:hypothetical protein
VLVAVSDADCLRWARNCPYALASAKIAVVAINSMTAIAAPRGQLLRLIAC